LAVCAVAAHVTLTRGRYGYRVRALGGNRESARLSGLLVRPLEVSIYILSGLAAGVVGVLLTSRLSAAYAQTGRTWELLVIASVIIGGTSLYGGVGTVIGSLAGATIIRVLSNALVILGISAYWQEVCIGVIIVAAVALDARSRRSRQRRQARRVQATVEKSGPEQLDLGSFYGESEQLVSYETSAPLLELRNIRRYFGYVRALENVSVTLYPREILALVGDNGAGKSTLIRIASGALEPDAGSIVVAGREVALRSPRAANDAGISTVYQNLALVECLDVAANLYLGREPSRAGLVRRRAMLSDATRVLSSLRVRIPSPAVPVADLSGG
jgi:ABC-type multidrug transport system fused ATPase/permease subunit